MSKQIKLIRMAMNTDRARAYGLVFKLKYFFPNRHKPQLQIFLDNEITRSEDWEIYGVGGLSEPWREPQNFYRYLEFEKLGQTKNFELGRNFQIKFTDISDEEVDYRRTGKAIEPAYHFQVTNVGSDEWHGKMHTVV